MQTFDEEERKKCKDDIHFILQSRKVMKQFLLPIFQGGGSQHIPEGGQYVECSTRQQGLRQDMMSG